MDPHAQPDVLILGRFPPPLDGQTMATRRLAEVLESRYHIQRINTEPPQTDYVAAEVRFRPERVRHFLGLRGRIRATLHASPSAPVLWPSISPERLGHWRDLLTVVPTFAPGQPVVGISHRATFDRVFAHPLTRPTARRLVERLAGVVFLSDEIADRCAPWIPDAKRRVIPNTVDEALTFTDADLATKWNRSADRPMQWLFLSNMMPEKGYRDILDALPIVRDRGIAFHAHFAGRWVRDADRTDFERRVAAAELARVVTHHGGLTDRTQVRALHLDADAFLLPTYHPTEGMPISIIEAMSAGSPIIATNHGGIPSMVRDGVEADFVQPRDPASIADALTALSEPETWQRRALAARSRFESTFSPDRVQAQWVDLVERLREPV